MYLTEFTTAVVNAAEKYGLNKFSITADEGFLTAEFCGYKDNGKVSINANEACNDDLIAELEDAAKYAFHH